MTHYEELAKHLSVMSKEICTDNDCTDDEHNCDSYAYMTISEMEGIDGKKYIDVMLLDICLSDYFRGCSSEYIAFPLPWEGDARQLKEDIEQEWLSLT